MTDGPDAARRGSRTSANGSVESLANQALKVLARQRGSGPFRLSESYVERLRAAILDGREGQRDAVLARMESDGVTPEDIIDYYVPEVSRRLGAEWCEDQLGFADVTIGASRLQSVLRDLTERTAIKPKAGTSTGVAVVVLADEFHTLGAMVLTAQLRRMGISVRLMLGAQEDDAIRNVRADKFDAILISASHTESLAALEKFVKNLKREAGRDTPIIIGGPILSLEQDVKRATGADFATSDIGEALRACRLKISPQDAEISVVGA